MIFALGERSDSKNSRLGRYVMVVSGVKTNFPLWRVYVVVYFSRMRKTVLKLLVSDTSMKRTLESLISVLPPTRLCMRYRSRIKAFSCGMGLQKISK